MKKLMFGRYCSTQTRLLTYLYKVEIAEQYANLTLMSEDNHYGFI